MNIVDVEQFAKRYRGFGLTGDPMPEMKIDELERTLGVDFPHCYRAYLSVAGNGPPPNLVGSDCHAAYLSQLREWAIDLLRENDDPILLPADAVVFLMHQGYQFFYFTTNVDLNDPPVRYYCEGNDGDSQEYETFSDWVRVVACGK